jgi:hypothetical protein
MCVHIIILFCIRRASRRLGSSEYCKPWEWRNSVQTLTRLIVNTHIYVNRCRTLWVLCRNKVHYHHHHHHHHHHYYYYINIRIHCSTQSTWYNTPVSWVWQNKLITWYFIRVWYYSLTVDIYFFLTVHSWIVHFQ